MEKQSPDDVIPEVLNSEAKKIYEMLSAIKNTLYDGCENYSQMSIIGRMTNLKTNIIAQRECMTICAL